MGGPPGSETGRHPGDGKGDTVAGKKGTGTLVTLIDRKSRYLLSDRPEAATGPNSIETRLTIRRKKAASSQTTIQRGNDTRMGIEGNRGVDRMRRAPYYRQVLTMMFVLGLGACATHEGTDAALNGGINDPHEETNRAIFAFNDGVDQAILRPASSAYKAVVPPPVRLVARNFAGHLGEPVTLLNEVMQGEFKQAEGTFWRFMVNTTLGGLGALDPATELGLPAHYEDFGQTLARYGASSGPYIVLPLIGPSSVRHTGGRVVDAFSNPFSYVGGGSAPFVAGVTRRSVRVVDSRAQNGSTIDSLRKTSPDYYAAVRSAYYQQRKAAIANGKLDADSLPDIGIE